MKRFVLPSLLGVLFLLCSSPATAQSWMICSSIDGQKIQVSVPKDPLRVQTDSGEWKIPLGTIREIKFVQREDSTEARIIFPNDFVARGRVQSREITMRTPDNRRIDLNTRVIRSIVNPILGGATPENKVLRQDLISTVVAPDGNTYERSFAFSQHRFRSDSYGKSFAISSPAIDQLEKAKSNRLIMRSIYGDQIAGRMDPAKFYSSGLDGFSGPLLPRDFNFLDMSGDALEIGGNYLWWYFKNGDRLCARVADGAVGIRTTDGLQSSASGITSIQPVDREWRFTDVNGVQVGRPTSKRLQLVCMVDSETREYSWKDIEQVTLPNTGPSAPLAATSDVAAVPSNPETFDPPATDIAAVPPFTPANPDTLEPGTLDTPATDFFPEVDPVTGEPKTMLDPDIAAVPNQDFPPQPEVVDLAIDEPPLPQPTALAPLPVQPRKAITPPPDMSADQWLNECRKLLFREAMVAGGSYKLGDSQNRGLEDEQPAIAVDVRNFYMDVTEVSVGAFKVFSNANRRFKTQAEKTGSLSTWRQPGFTQADDEPVVWVSWNDAAEYCNWRSTQLGLEKCYSARDGNVVCDRSKNGYRLPTEAEWEYAVRGGGQPGVFPFGTGDDLSNAEAVDLANFKQTPGAVFDGYRFTSPAGTYPANRLGIFDLTGNVWEWCEDYYHREAYYYVLSREKNDPCVEIGDSARLVDKVMRGGSWENESLDFLRCASRGKGPMRGSKGSVGFRCVRTAP